MVTLFRYQVSQDILTDLQWILSRFCLCLLTFCRLHAILHDNLNVKRTYYSKFQKAAEHAAESQTQSITVRFIVKLISNNTHIILRADTLCVRPEMSFLWDCRKLPAPIENTIWFSFTRKAFMSYFTSLIPVAWRQSPSLLGPAGPRAVTPRGESRWFTSFGPRAHVSRIATTEAARSQAGYHMQTYIRGRRKSGNYYWRRSLRPIQI